MIYSIRGQVLIKELQFAVIDMHGIGLKVSMTARALANLPLPGDEVELFSHLNVKEDALDLYGFTSKEELGFFEMVIGVSGVGPKSALAILDVAPLSELCAAIEAGRPDLLTRASGVGRKTAERIILDLRGKVSAPEGEATVRRMEGDTDLIDTLVGLGYKRDQAKAAIEKIAPETEGLESRLKAVLKVLGTRNR